MKQLILLLAAKLYFSTFLYAQMMPNVQHVLLIGVDGLSPAGIQAATTPTLDSLMQAGAYSMTARAVLPSSSNPNWASMIMGASPEEHGIMDNDWRPKDIGERAFCGQEAGEMWPTIFRLVRENYPNADLATFHDWSTIGRLIEPGVLNMLADTRGAERTASAAADYLTAYEPELTFVHLDHVDHAGHSYGWGTDAYHRAVGKADGLILEILDGLRVKGKLEETVVIVTSDHGGIDSKHGGTTPEEFTIPWIISGPSIKSDSRLEDSIMTYDTAATIAYIFGIQPPSCWIGRPVLSAFFDE